METNGAFDKRRILALAVAIADGMSRAERLSKQSATLAKSYARLLPTRLCLMKPEALSHLTRLANDFAFISFMAWLRILIVISLIGVATDLYRIREVQRVQASRLPRQTKVWAPDTNM